MQVADFGGRVPSPKGDMPGGCAGFLAFGYTVLSGLYGVHIGLNVGLIKTVAVFMSRRVSGSGLSEVLGILRLRAFGFSVQDVCALSVQRFRVSQGLSCLWVEECRVVGRVRLLLFVGSWAG